MASVGPFPISVVIDRIEDECPGFALISGIAELVAAQKGTAPLPAAYVMLADEGATPHSGGSQVTIQKVRARIAVVLAVRNRRREDMGNEVNADLFTQINLVRAALMGWNPTDPNADPLPAMADFENASTTAFDLVSGALLAYDAATVWWQETFEINYWTRQ